MVEPAWQNVFIEKIRTLWGGAQAPPLAFVDTYGCQQNEADSERIRGLLIEVGYGLTDDEHSADLIVINTCAVREHAEMRVLGNVGALVHVKRVKPNLIIALCGCMMEEPHAVEKIKQSFRHVDIVFGTRALPQFPELLWDKLNMGGRHLLPPGGEDEIVEDLPVKRGPPPRAWVSVMYGCNNFCSYCIVPYVRGRERSREPQRILDEVRALIAQGYSEFTLLGQNVNSYRGGVTDMADFSDLLTHVCALPGDFSVRFMTSHPKDAGDKLFETMACNPKMARHIHLPFQSGSDRILAAMNRGYTSAHYLELIQKARALMPDLNITSDVIVGFPGETEEEFEDTLRLMEQVRFDNLFTFIYSKRSGTPAADMVDPITPEVKRERMTRLLALQKGIRDG